MMSKCQRCWIKINTNTLLPIIIMQLWLLIQANLTVDGINGLDDVDQCVIYYNQAVVLYYQKQYNVAITLLDKLFQFVEPMGKILVGSV